MISRKTQKFRGSRTYGRGYKAGRGKGLIGGSGKSGLSKHKKMMLENKHTYFGRKHFTRPLCVKVDYKTLKLSDLYFQMIHSEISSISINELYGQNVKILYNKVPEGYRLMNEISVTLWAASRKVLEHLKNDPFVSVNIL